MDAYIYACGVTCKPNQRLRQGLSPLHTLLPGEASGAQDRILPAAAVAGFAVGCVAQCGAVGPSSGASCAKVSVRHCLFWRNFGPSVAHVAPPTRRPMISTPSALPRRYASSFPTRARVLPSST